MKLLTHHTAKTVRGQRYWRGVVMPRGSYSSGRRAYVEIGRNDSGYFYCVTTDGMSRYSGYAVNLRNALQRAAHYAWHVTHPNDRNPY